MAHLKCAIVWLVFLLAHLDLELVHGLSAYALKRCPPSASPECPPTVTNACNNDQDCETRYPGKGYKCCDDCGRSCVAPVVSTVEVTPAKILRLKTLTKLVAKCPTNPPSSESSPGPDQECQNDASCDAKFPGKGLKCCSDGCDYRCIPPVVETVSLPGYCPEPPPVNQSECYGIENRFECMLDADCERQHPALKASVKCCSGKCNSRVCMIPIQGKPPPTPPPRGTCPRFPTPAECPPEPDNECTDEQNCDTLHPGLELTCCIDGCDLRCVPPIPLP